MKTNVVTVALIALLLPACMVRRPLAGEVKAPDLETAVKKAEVLCDGPVKVRAVTPIVRQQLSCVGAGANSPICLNGTKESQVEMTCQQSGKRAVATIPYKKPNGI